MRTALALALASLLFSAARAGAQPPPQASLQITVIDSTRAVLVGATVTVEGLEPATKATPSAPVQTSAQGLAVIPRLAPGRYSLQVESGGFESVKMPEI